MAGRVCADPRRGASAGHGNWFRPPAGGKATHHDRCNAMALMLTRRQAFHTMAGAAAIASPVILVAFPRAAQPSVRLRRGMNLWPWFSLTREFPPPRTD